MRTEDFDRGSDAYDDDDYLRYVSPTDVDQVKTALRSDAGESERDSGAAAEAYQLLDILGDSVFYDASVRRDLPTQPLPLFVFWPHRVRLLTFALFVF